MVKTLNIISNIFSIVYLVWKILTGKHSMSNVVTKNLKKKNEKKHPMKTLSRWEEQMKGEIIFSFSFFFGRLQHGDGGNCWVEGERL